MEYAKGYVYELMDNGGPTNIMEPYFVEAVDEMMRARTLCAKANAKMPDDPTYVDDLEELFGIKLDDVISKNLRPNGRSFPSLFKWRHIPTSRRRNSVRPWINITLSS
ncbi:hypothetical protein [Oribacterium sp. FC2011]|uniref:hypothetical protein n=1 Tax=Oribacterium sp. FC2011 TaxID=1408311 RepID=UPI000B1D7A99|nr:hypothetical protein [Oribacterium sp. FC2011]